MKIIDEQLMNDLAEEAKKSPRLRKNYNFHQSLQDKCHRFLNALEPGTFIPVHHHPDKDETFVILKGKVRVTTYNDEGKILDSCVISQESGRYRDMTRGHAIARVFIILTQRICPSSKRLLQKNRRTTISR